MKVVYNSKGFGLQLTPDEMKMMCRKLNLTLNQHNKGSSGTWFRGVYWEEFRADPRLVELVEAGVLSNKNLRIVEIPDEVEWEIDTDWQTYEDVCYYLEWNTNQQFNQHKENQNDTSSY